MGQIRIGDRRETLDIKHYECDMVRKTTWKRRLGKKGATFDTSIESSSRGRQIEGLEEKTNHLECQHPSDALI
jgi:hypothetical protein